MHLEIRQAEGRKKYYLAYSYRDKGKTRKIRVYIGADLPKSEFEEKRKKAEEEIKKRLPLAKSYRDPYETALSKAEMEELSTLESKGRIKLLHLSEEDWLKFTEAFTYDTNAIEGSTVTENEVEKILEENKWPEKPKDEISETYGVAQAVAYVRKTKEHVSLGLMKELHRIVFKNSKAFSGKFRARGVEVAVMNRFGGVVHRGALSTQVIPLLKKLVKWYNLNKMRYPPLILAALVHNQFENVHPFQDGNGRVGRLLLINILLKHGLPPLNIELESRQGYYSALQAYQLNGNIRPTLDLMLKEYGKLKAKLGKR